MKKLTPIHPGEILAEEFLRPMGVSQSRLARDISVPPRRINEISRGKRGITADTALRFARYFGTTAEFWMTLQQRYELERLKDRMESRLKAEVRPLRSRAAWGDQTPPEPREERGTVPGSIQNSSLTPQGSSARLLVFSPTYPARCLQ